MACGHGLRGPLPGAGDATLSSFRGGIPVARTGKLLLLLLLPGGFTRGAHRVLKAHEPLLHELGTVLLLFQPAEEGGGGAKRMAQEGALRLRAAEEGGGEEGGVQAQAVVGLHVWPGLPTGTIASKVRAARSGVGAGHLTLSFRARRWCGRSGNAC